MNDHKALHRAWRIYSVRKKLGVPIATPLPVKATKDARAAVKQLCRESKGSDSPIRATLEVTRSAELMAALDCVDWQGANDDPSPQDYAAPTLIDEYLSEARRYARTSRSLLDSGPADLEIPKDFVRSWLNDLRRHMPSKIVPLCAAAELTVDRRKELRASYQELEADLREGIKQALKFPRGRTAACKVAWDDFVVGVEAWCREYETRIAGAQP